MNIGVVGVGHLGKIHVKCLQETSFSLVGVFDSNQSKANLIAQDYGIEAFQSLEILISSVDALVIVSDTSSHQSIAIQALTAGKHLFIEKPVTSSLEECKEILELSKLNPKKIIQIGHVERYNPAFQAIETMICSPKFIEVHRLSNFNPRGNDVSVVLDLMIHDLDILLHCVDSTVKDIRANGVHIVSNSADICNARIEFENGCVANLTASRLSLNNMRKFRIFQSDAYLSIDFLEKTCQRLGISENEKDGMLLETSSGNKYLNINIPEIKETNAIVEELKDFYNSINCGTTVSVDIHQAYNIMELAHQIESLIEKH